MINVTTTVSVKPEEDVSEWKVEARMGDFVFEVQAGPITYLFYNRKQAAEFVDTIRSIREVAA
jgi:hypothetical protein